MAFQSQTPSFLFPQSLDAQSRPKSPKSPKMTLENPLLKGPFMTGSATSVAAPSLISEQVPRTPLAPMNHSNNNIHHNNNSNSTNNNNNGREKPLQLSFMATPGPPPKASLSLMGTVPSIHPTTPVQPTPVEPAPVASPRMSHSQTPTMMMSPNLSGIASLSSSSSSSEHWVVAYGYQTVQEYQELLERLSSYGTIVQQQSSNGKNNWFAIRYEGVLSTEKALCGQPIILSTNSLCGTVRGSPELLQSLAGGGGVVVGDVYHNNNNKDDRQLFLALEGNTAARRTTSSSSIGGNGKNKKEEDILAYNDHHRSSRSGDRGQQLDRSEYRRKSPCERFVAWYFQWPDDEQHHAHLE